METKVEEYVLVPKNDGNRTSIPSASKPSVAHSSSDIQPENKSSTSAGNIEGVEVGAIKKEAKRKYTKRSVSEPESKKSRKTDSNETNTSINVADETSRDESTPEKKIKKPRVKKAVVNSPVDTLDDSSEITTENRNPSPKRPKNHSSLKEKCARLEETWVKL